MPAGQGTKRKGRIPAGHGSTGHGYIAHWRGGDYPRGYKPIGFPPRPPGEETEADGSTRVALVHELLRSHSRALRGCLWSFDTTPIFGPSTPDNLKWRTTMNMPELLRKKGMPQTEFDEFIRDVQRGWLRAAPAFSIKCAALSAASWAFLPFGACCFCYLACHPTTMERLADTVESALEARNETWRANYQVEVWIDRDVQYLRPPGGADDVDKRFEFQSREWIGNVLVISPVTGS